MSRSTARRAALLVAVAAASALAGCGADAAHASHRGPAELSGARATGTAPTGGADMPLATPVMVAPADGMGPPGRAVVAAQVLPPVRLRIPAIAVDAALGRVGLQADGTIAVPADWNQPAWYTDAAAPGQQGPAVVVGHLDSNTGPAVFWRLAKLRPGDAILVTRQDGSTLTFDVTQVGRFARAAFPTAEVYGPTAGSTLRLITCGGTFDWAVHRYTDNVVVFADVG